MGQISKKEAFLLFLLSPFLLMWSFLKWVATRLGLYKEKVYGDLDQTNDED